MGRASLYYPLLLVGKGQGDAGASVVGDGGSAGVALFGARARTLWLDLPAVAGKPSSQTGLGATSGAGLPACGPCGFRTSTGVLSWSQTRHSFAPR